LRSLIIRLPPFDCQVDNLDEDSDEEFDQDSEDNGNHKCFWKVLIDCISGCETLKNFEFSGSSVPAEIACEILSHCSSASFEKSKPAPQIRRNFDPSYCINEVHSESGEEEEGTGELDQDYLSDVEE
jgi:hypothetical protein